MKKKNIENFIIKMSSLNELVDTSLSSDLSLLSCVDKKEYILMSITNDDNDDGIKLISKSSDTTLLKILETMESYMDEKEKHNAWVNLIKEEWNAVWKENGGFDLNIETIKMPCEPTPFVDFMLKTKGVCEFFKGRAFTDRILMTDNGTYLLTFFEKQGDTTKFVKYMII